MQLGLACVESEKMNLRSLRSREKRAKKKINDLVRAIMYADETGNIAPLMNLTGLTPMDLASRIKYESGMERVSQGLIVSTFDGWPDYTTIPKDWKPKKK